ncbi:LuxR family transcriptional regulator [Blastococcus sp. URHD0036]|uniref:helix-turn-helix transcriptional regulator n=1 Tax=Blastococcus sp. URHD0036 TaxID=1380356 RepID=UPI0004985448|nr:LuxR family transcriptional regulator [Blastococcus sp. URHD0036]
MDRAEERQRPTPLIGRARELDLLHGFLGRAAEGGAALVLTGDAGVGRTALLDTAARAAAAGGARVLRAAGTESEADVDNAGLNQLLLPVLGVLRSLSDAQRGVLEVSLGLRAGAPADRLVVSTAVLTALRELAVEAPVVLVVDDLQWLDRESVRAVGFVARRLVGARIGVLAASRMGPLDAPPLAGIPTHEVQPLPDGAAEELLRIRSPTLAAGVRRRVLAAAQGSPLALVELPAALSGPQQRAVAALPEVLPLGGRLRARLAARMSSLPAGTRHLLLMSALDGTGDLGVLRAAAPDEGWLDALGPAERAQLVAVDVAGRTLSWRHPLVAAATVELATSGERRRAHRALADVLTDSPERRGRHLAEAAVGADQEAADLLDQAAHRALHTGDGVHAVTGLLRAADLSPDGPDRARRLAEAAYLGADVAGELYRVPELLRRARSADPAAGESLQTAVAAAYHLLNTDGDVDHAHAVLVRAIEAALRDGGGAAELEDALHSLLVVCHFSGRAETWQPLDAAVDRLRGQVGPVLAAAARTLGDPAASTADDLGRLDEVIDGLDRETDPARIVRTGIAAFYVDRLDDCREALERVAADGRRGGAVASAVQALMMLCHEAFGAGRWDDARRSAREGVELGEASGYRLVSLPGVYCLALLAAVEGDAEAARRQTDQMVAWARPRGARAVEHFAHRVAGLSALGRGDPEEAYRQAVAISPPGALAAHVPVALGVGMDLVEAAVHTGRHAAAAGHVAAMQGSAVFGLRPRLALLAAGSAAMAAPEGAAVACFEQALAVPRADAYPFEFARVQLAYGEHLRRSRATGAARVQLTAACEAFARLGAAPWVARASQELRATGKPRDRGARDASVVLTPQEHEIAMLAATGLTNKQIGAQLYLSHRTVSAHLYRVFPKLGIASRAALRDALTQRPAVG